jgi:hypothetical protein
MSNIFDLFQRACGIKVWDSGVMEGARITNVFDLFHDDIFILSSNIFVDMFKNGFHISSDMCQPDWLPSAHLLIDSNL